MKLIDRFSRVSEYEYQLLTRKYLYELSFSVPKSIWRLYVNEFKDGRYQQVSVYDLDRTLAESENKLQMCGVKCKTYSNHS